MCLDSLSLQHLLWCPQADTAVLRLLCCVCWIGMQSDMLRRPFLRRSYCTPCRACLLHTVCHKLRSKARYLDELEDSAGGLFGWMMGREVG